MTGREPEGHALHVERQAAEAAQLLAAAGAAGAPVDEHGQDGAGAGRSLRDLGAAEEDAPVVGRDPEHGLRREHGVFRIDGRHEPAAPAADELRRLRRRPRVGHERGHGPEDLARVHGGGGSARLDLDQDGRGEESLARGHAQGLDLAAAEDEPPVARELGDSGPHVFELGGGGHRAHADLLQRRIADRDPL